MSGHVLVSTHDLPRAGALRETFEGEGYPVELVTPDEDLGRLDEPVLLVLSGAGGAEESRELIHRAGEDLGVPVLAYASDESEARRVQEAGAGLIEVFPPDADVDEVVLVGRRLVERRRLQDVTGIVGETDAMREVLERVVQIAPVNSTVLVTGESGTGKELVARGLHALSPRKHKPFIAVNVAALSDTLLESELFGHEKGAFTGAVDARRGFFQLADQGTIFLDEIGEMPPGIQTKLLRVLEQREFLRVGGEEPIRVDVRIIAATNQNLRERVALGKFRKDLYYRLNVLHIELPPLRERTEDIPRLVKAFIKEISEDHDRSFPGISDEAMEILQQHHWPGNVRELRNLVESMVVLAPGRKILPSDIPPEVRGVGRGRALVPASLPSPPERWDDEEELPPQLEFVFRTLVELRVDMDDLRRDFEAYRERMEEMALLGSGGEARRREIRVPDEELPQVLEVTPRRRETEEGEGAEAAEEASPAPETAREDEGEDGREDLVVYRPGMTMEDLEKKAIAAALREVDGNRRKASELLGIGERTLYRKLRKYDLEED